MMMPSRPHAYGFACAHEIFHRGAHFFARCAGRRAGAAEGRFDEQHAASSERTGDLQAGGGSMARSP